MASNKMLIDASHPEETRVAVVRGNRVEEFDFEAQAKKQLRGNIYLAKVTRVEPSLQAAFVDYGGNRHGFLAFSEIHPDYYQIPVADRQALLEEEAREAEENGEDEAAEPRQRASSRQSRRRRGRGGDGGRAEGKGESGERRAARAASGTAIPDAEPVGPLADALAAGEMEAGDAPAPTTMAAATPSDRISEPAPDGDGEETGGSEEGRPSRRRRTRRKPAAAAKSEKAESGEPAAEPVAMNVEEDSDDEDDQARRPRTGGRAARKADEESEEDDGGVAEAGTDEDEQIESVGQEDALEEVPQRRKLRRQYKIQEVIKRRQIMLVQVVKEERGNKGAALTTYLSLAGRYCVLMPNTARGGGISRKITNANDRKRLKAIAGELNVPGGMGVILRTAGASRTKAEIKRDFEYLLRLWENVRALTLSSAAPCLVYEEGSLIKRSIRDLYDKDTGEILVQGEAGYREAKDFMRMLMPSHAKNVKPYVETQSIFSRSGVESQLDKLLTPQVTLKSGGYLVINQTEALVSIDVNSGRSTREHSIEDTALQTNLEAADEIARQLRLRDLAGLIVIDFIDMEEKRNNRAVEKRLKDALKHDRARIQVGRISHFGLMEMSRQRIRVSVMESTMEVCPHCQGLGHVRSNASIALHVFRGIEDHVSRHSRNDVVVRCPPEIALDVLNLKRAGLHELELHYGVRIIVEGDVSLPGQSFVIEKGEPASGTPQGPKPATPGAYEAAEEEEEAVAELEAEETDEAGGEEDEDERGRRRGKRRRSKRRRRRPSDEERAAEAGTGEAGEEVEEGETEAAEEEDVEAAGERAGRKRRRGKRGGRKNRRTESGAEEVSGEGETSAEETDEEAVAAEAAEEPAEAGTAMDDSATQEVTAEVEEAAGAETGEETGEGEEESAEQARRRRNTRRPRGAVAERAAAGGGEVTSESAPEEDEAEPATEEAKPKRSGWWSRGGGFF